MAAIVIEKRDGAKDEERERQEHSTAKGLRVHEEFNIRGAEENEECAEEGNDSPEEDEEHGLLDLSASADSLEENREK